MLVLHAGIREPGALFDEAEDGAGRPRPRRGGGVAVHPRQARRRALRSTLGWFLGSRWPARPEKAEAILRLPVEGEVPLPSRAAPGETAGPRAPFRVEGYQAPLRDCLDLLRGPPEPREPLVAWGDSVLMRLALGTLAEEVLDRRALAPSLEPATRGKGWRARWRARVPVGAEDPQGRLADGAPGCWFAEGNGDRRARLARQLDLVVDAAARTRLAGARPAEVGGAAGLLAEALVGEDAELHGHVPGLVELVRTLEAEHLAATDPPRAAWRTLLRVLEPVEPGDPWGLEPMAQARAEPSLRLGPRELSEPDRATRVLLRRVSADPRPVLAADLARLGLQDPALAGWGGEPSIRALDPGELLRVLEALAPRQVELDVTLEVPAWWTRRSRSLGWHAELAPVEMGVEVHDRFGMEALTRFRLVLAMGGEPLSEEELRRLAELQAPLVRFRGHWVELDAASLAAARAAVEGPPPAGEANLAEALRLAAGLEAGPGGLPVEACSGEDWVAGLLEPGAPAPAWEEPPGLEAELRPYQREGVAWLESREARGVGACLADDMGLGKTLQVIALVLREPTTGPTLVVCPLSVLGNWERELARFAPELAVHVHHGPARVAGARLAAEAGAASLVLTTYDTLARDHGDLGQVRWHRVVLDEAQNVKNPRTRRARALRSLRSSRRLALTGTPLENRLLELWTLMDFLNPGLLGSRKAFRRLLAGPIEREADGDALARLRRLVGPFLLRRRKDDPGILPELPPKLEQTWACPLTREQAGLYRAVTQDMLEQVEQAEGMARRGLVLGALTRLKQICNHPAHFLGQGRADPARSGKLARFAELAEEIFEAGEKLLVFTQYRAWGELLRDFLKESFAGPVPFLHGGVARARRDKLVHRFQEDPAVRVLLVSLRAGGTGLNLTAAAHVLHFDRWWNPAVEDQATDRAHRIGQDRPVQVHRLVTRGTLEERIDQLLREKRELAQRVLAPGEAGWSELGLAELRELVALAPGAWA